ncbi:MAG TPA: hypothetical protein VHX88_17540 [Solirubrobacteraceae bacterium]|nr:hypothetical protein [Solirubrobacteraceae bacterium]
MSASFGHIPGSDGAGNTEYSLRLAARHASCTLGGAIKLQLLSRTAARNPTHLDSRIAPKTLTMAGTHVALRFSPDVSGVGEPDTKQCEARRPPKS